MDEFGGKKHRNFDKLSWKHSEIIGEELDYEDTILRSQAGECKTEKYSGQIRLLIMSCCISTSVVDALC